MSLPNDLGMLGASGLSATSEPTIAAAAADSPGSSLADSPARRIAAALDAWPVTPTHRFARVIIGSATFFDGFDVLAIAAVMPVLIHTWSLSAQFIGYIISTGFVGQLLGTLLFAYLSDRYGRLRCTSWSVGLFALGSLACGLANTPGAFMAARFFQGIGLGGELPVAATYINELAQSKRRGRFVIAYELLFAIGLFAASVAGTWIVPGWGWRAMFYIGALPAIVALVTRVLLPESPRWLAAKGRYAEATRALLRLRRIPLAEQTALQAPHTAGVAPEVPELAPKTDTANWLLMFRPPYLRRTLVLAALWSAGGVLTFGLTVWMPSVYRQVFHTDLATALRYGTYTTFGGLLGAGLCALVIDKVGRRRWMTVSWSCGTLSLLVLFFNPSLSAFATAIWVSIAFGTSSSGFIACYTYTPELYPTAIRTSGVGFASGILRLSSILAPMVIGWAVARHALNLVFLLTACSASVAAIAVGVFGEETRERLLEDISPTN